ncbi:MAG: hypothetical protein J6I98_07675, partial [Clostridia bacterium]|nr:hypothetical protein [Clostridia bacterium]
SMLSISKGIILFLLGFVFSRCGLRNILYLHSSSTGAETAAQRIFSFIQTPVKYFTFTDLTESCKNSVAYIL